jgi:hypothetical protein
MITGNGSSYLESGASGHAVAKAMVTSIKQASSKDAPSKLPAVDESWTSFADALQKLVEGNAELRASVEELMARGARQALAYSDVPLPATSDLVALIRSKGVGVPSKGGTVVRTFWWGFHIQISEEDLQAFLAGATAVNTIVGVIGGGIPSPAQPWIALAAAFVASALGALRAINRGQGIYVSMSWFAPGAFVPTPV